MLTLIMLRKNLLFVLLFLFFLTAYLILGIQKYNRFETGEDLAMYCQIIWHYSRFETPFVSIAVTDPLNLALTRPIMALLTPLFWLWQNSLILIIVQQLIVVFGAIPVYLLSLRLLKTKYLGLIISFLYLYFIGIQSAVYSDFHGATIVSSFLAFSIYFLETKNWKFYWPFLFLAMLCKEDIPPLIFSLGLYLVIFKKEYKRGVLTLLLSILYYYFIYNILLPLTAKNIIQPENINLGRGTSLLNMLITSPLEFFKNFINPLVKLRNIILILISFGFMPLLSPIFWMLAPITFLRFFSDPARYSLHYHYTASIAPILAFATIDFLKRVKNKPKIITLFMGLAIVGTFYANKPNLDPGFPTPPISFVFNRAFYVLPPRNKDYDKILSLIPKNASVSAQWPLLAHSCFRKKIDRFPGSLEKAEYIALTFTESPYPLTSLEYETLKQKLLEDPQFEKLYFSYAGVLLRRKI